MEGKVAIVTGGSAGIGRATALAFAARGARVVVADVEEEGGRETVEMVERDGGEAVFVATDVSSPDDVARMVATAKERFGRLDIAFNNAGIEGDLAPLVEYSLDTWNRIVGINLTGVWLCMKHEIPLMLETGGGSIVNNASILGTVGMAAAGPYTATKHGVIGLTRVAALENAEKGIRVNAVCPGFIETPMVMERGVHAGENQEVYDDLVGLHPVGRLGKSEEIADAVVWLCSDGASFMAGHPLIVDGGYVAR
jgi:NAD(P)-dependent dehydrogenase (short-subunit alcohol dehydrogenase family)